MLLFLSMWWYWFSCFCSWLICCMVTTSCFSNNGDSWTCILPVSFNFPSGCFTLTCPAWLIWASKTSYLSVLQGDYDPTRTKVLHLPTNPSAKAQEQRQQELKQLKEENERLLARVQLLEQAGGPVEDLTLQVDKQLESVPESKAIEGKALSKQGTETWQSGGQLSF